MHGGVWAGADKAEVGGREKGQDQVCEMMDTKMSDGGSEGRRKESGLRNKRNRPSVTPGTWVL